MIEPVLKPCPFCGAPAFLWRTFQQVTIECSKYHTDTHRIMVSGDTDDEAVERWNRRANGRENDSTA